MITVKTRKNTTILTFHKQYYKNGNNYRCHIHYQGKTYSAGTFASEEDAHIAYLTFQKAIKDGTFFELIQHKPNAKKEGLEALLQYWHIQAKKAEIL